MYAYNLRGDMLPPLFIFESKSKESVNYTIDTRICENLPTVTLENTVEMRSSATHLKLQFVRKDQWMFHFGLCTIGSV